MGYRNPGKAPALPSTSDYPRTFECGTGNEARDGYKEIGRGEKDGPDTYGTPMSVYDPAPRRGFRNSDGLAEPVYQGPRFLPDDF